MNFFTSIMVDEGRGWMYGSWKKSGAHTREWMNKTQKFIDHAFSILTNRGVKCTCSKCRNALCEDKKTLTLHLYKFDFILGCDILTKGLIGLIEYSYHQGIPSFPEAHLQRTPRLSMLGPEQFQDG
jgi:hypothetical protein